MVQAAFLLGEGKTDEAILSLERADQLADGSTQAAASLGYAWARNGQPERARAVLKRLFTLNESRYVPPTSLGLIHAGLRDPEATIAVLERGLAVRTVRMTLVRKDGRWQLVKDDPRFQALMRRMRLV
ncbi:MAG: tetratricopeptide repeat protein, partial [Rubrivivax sp.]